MDGNSSLERRYSFNMAQGNPVAESTHLNGSSFSWGSSMSPRRRSNSSYCLNNTHASSDCNNKSIVSPKSKNITKIDAGIAADVQSKGLASRIVKYHESGTRLNRSMSAQNLYNKPGQFPAVTLKKTDLPYRATKQELSMIRIPPPEKSSFYGNTISSLLRSSSVVGLQSKRTEDLSRENRPIIHPPPTENDMAPTRSVLDVLKEISRKRINSDDLEADETSKKYCNRSGIDFVDTGSNTNPQHFTASAPCQRYKRQRDCITPHQNVKLLETTKTSPEQAKKRVCNYNNDITSSLSSSIKCKLYGSTKRMSASHNLNQTMPTNLESYETQKAKMQRYQDHNNKNNTRVDVRFENLENTLRKVDSIKPITPIPATPCAEDQQSNVGGVPPKRTVSEPLYSTDRNIAMNAIQPANKPRLTLFNKKCEDNEGAATKESGESVAENTDDLNDFGECAGIPFVKPKKISISGLRNPVIERTQKSKLALMLSGLRGELYQNSDADELDSSKENPNKSEDNKMNTNASAVISALKSTSAVTTLTTVTSSSNVEVPKVSNTFSFTTSTKTTVSSPPASTKMTSSPLVGLKLSQPKQSTENKSSSMNSEHIKSAEKHSTTNVPVLVGFSLGTTNTSSALAVNTTASNNVLKDPKTAESSISLNTTSNNNAFNFGQLTQLSSISSHNNGNKLSEVVQFPTKTSSLQFPTVSTATSNTNTTSNINTTSNTDTTSNTNTTTCSPATSTSTASAFSFGKNMTAPIPSSGSANTVSDAVPFKNTAKSSNAFSFNDPSTSLPQTTTSPAPITFGNAASSVATTNTNSSSSITTTTNSTLAFGTVSTSTNLGGLTNTSSFTFNTPKQLTTSAATTTTSTGGGVSSAPFSFGSNVTAPSIPTFGTINAGIKTQPTITAFSFGSDTKNQTSSSGQNKSANKTENNAFDANSRLFGSASLNSPSTGGSSPIFGSNTNNTEKNVFNSLNATSIFGSNSVKTGTPTFGSGADNKPAVLSTPSLFGGSSINSSAPAPFSFGSKPAIAQSTNSNNANTASGGFSFSSAVSNNSENGATFGFGSKTSGTTNTPNTFSGASTIAIQNKSFTFGSSASKAGNNIPSVFGVGVNKPIENTTSPGGFTFGSALAPKTSTSFSFGAGANSFSNSNVSNTTNTAGGFTFGSTAASKPNEVLTNKPFAFGSSLPTQQPQVLSTPNNNVISSNIFGSTATNKTTPSTSFNFNSGSSTALQSNAPPANNIFAPPPTNITGERPIRRATRRLQK